MSNKRSTRNYFLSARTQPFWSLMYLMQSMLLTST